MLSQDGQSCEPPDRAGREFTYTTLADGPQKGHETLRHLHTCLNDQIKKKVPKSMRSLCGAKHKEHKGSYQRWQDFSAPTRAYLLAQALDYLVPLPTECRKMRVVRNN